MILKFSEGAQRVNDMHPDKAGKITIERFCLFQQPIQPSFGARPAQQQPVNLPDLLPEIRLCHP